MATRADLLHLFGDRILLEGVARPAGISPRAVEDTLDRTRVQFSATSEQEWSHVTDRRRLVAVDRRALDEGTPSGSAGTVDVEDYAVLFELDQLRADRLGRRTAARRTFDVVMIDEAQEMAPLELALLGRTLKPDGTLIVAGDAQQHMDPTATFVDWGATMRELGRPAHETVTLDIGYRCPPEVVLLARSILSPDAPAPGEIVVRAFESEQRLDRWAARELANLQRRDRRSSVAVLCRSPLRARRLAASLQASECPARVVFDGRFLPRGVQVTTVDQVKGLEFDFVLVADADAREFPADDFARRALYVAVTRARHQVVLACVGEPSPLIAAPARRGP
jgi:superfamily I DNA/RNA helicase